KLLENWLFFGPFVFTSFFENYRKNPGVKSPLVIVQVEQIFLLALKFIQLDIICHYSQVNEAKYKIDLNCCETF
ncbi:hypothetical protein BpHYR1_047852, partial [Brachionus plicatilis]